MIEYKDSNSKEWLVYVLNIGCEFLKNKNYLDVSDEDFIEESEKQGNVFSLKYFEWAFNGKNVSQDICVIRILYV